jgi:hypothetical protein
MNAPRPSSRHDGIALIVTLALIALLSLTLIAFMSSTILEREIAVTFSEEARGRAIAEAALADAVARLEAATVQSPATAATWVAAPGVVYALRAGQPPATYPLYNPASPQRAGYQFVEQELLGNNLNRDGWVCGVNSAYPFPGFTPLTGWGTQTTQRAWVNYTWESIIAPGWQTLGTNFATAGDTTGSGGYINPIVGRYTYWIDPESCKVNVSLAKVRGTYPSDGSTTLTENPGINNRSLVSEIDLRGLTGILSNMSGSMLAGFTDYDRSQYTSGPWRRPFPTLEHVRLPSFQNWNAQPLESFNSNKFYLTVYGSDDGLTAFGSNRVDLAALTMAATNLFSQSFYADVLYPNVFGAGSRRTLAAKYGVFGAAQIVANIIDYQQPASAWPTISSYSTNPADENYGIPQRYAGLKKGPMLEQVWIYAATNQVQGTNVDVSVFINAKFVNGYDTAKGNGYIFRTLPEAVQVWYENPPGTPQGPVNMPIAGESLPQTISSDMAPGEYRPLNAVIQAGTPEFKMTLSGSASNILPLVTRVNVKLRRVRLLRSNDPADIADWMTKSDFDAVFPQGVDFGVPFTFQEPNPSNGTLLVTRTLTNNIVSTTNLVANFTATASAEFRPIALGKHDPRVRTFPGWAGADFANNSTNNFQANWTGFGYDHIKPTAEDLCSTNFNSLPIAGYGLLANVRADNGSGWPSHRYLDSRISETNMTSVGELAEIHTGYPWRTLRLASVRPFTSGGFATNIVNQWFTTDSVSTNGSPGDPNAGREDCEANAAPDWLLLDMFTAGPAVSGGRININQRFTGPAAQLASRRQPLMALIYGTDSNLTYNATGAAAGSLPWAAQTIADRAFVTNSPYAANAPFYLTPGEVCEAQGLAFTSAGASRQPALRDRAVVVNRIGNLLTTRSDVFTLWVVAEYLRDLDADGYYDWQFLARYRLAQTNAPAGIDPTWWQGNIVGQSNLIAGLNEVTLNVSGDGDSDLDLDMILARVRVQAVIQRYVEGGVVKYRTLFTRFYYD